MCRESLHRPSRSSAVKNLRKSLGKTLGCEDSRVRWDKPCTGRLCRVNNDRVNVEGRESQLPTRVISAEIIMAKTAKGKKMGGKVRSAPFARKEINAERRAGKCRARVRDLRAVGVRGEWRIGGEAVRIAVCNRVCVVYCVRPRDSGAIRSKAKECDWCGTYLRKVEGRSVIVSLGDAAMRPSRPFSRGLGGPPPLTSLSLIFILGLVVGSGCRSSWPCSGRLVHSKLHNEHRAVLYPPPVPPPVSPTAAR
jgi:hypothetical protein